MPKQTKTSKCWRPSPLNAGGQKSPQAWQKELQIMSKPFLDDEIMDSHYPRCGLINFQQPKLRRCPVDIDSIYFVRGRIQSNKDARFGTGLDGGLDGYNWKIRCESEWGRQIRVLKLFWDATPDPPHYFAAQRECQNAALFQMMEAALSKSQEDPILLDPNPKTQQAANTNLLAFSDEHRSCSKPSNLAAITHIPRMRKCYGWLQFTGEQLFNRLPVELDPPYIEVDKVKRFIDPETRYTAVVYEFVEEGENDPVDMQSVLDFFWLTGFNHVLSPKAENWKSNVLVDLSDIIHSTGFGWGDREYGRCTAGDVLR